jgi:hypothetical protein
MLFIIFNVFIALRQQTDVEGLYKQIAFKLQVLRDRV